MMIQTVTSLILGIIGFIMIGEHSGYVTAIGIILLLWANNISVRLRNQ